MSSKKKTRLFIAIGFASILIIGIIVWVKQPATVTQQDIEKANEVAQDEELDDIINAGISGEDSSSVVEGDSL